MQVDDNMLYCGIANQPSAACSSLNLTDFLSILQIMKCFIKDFCETLQAGVVIFSMQIDINIYTSDNEMFYKRFL